MMAYLLTCCEALDIKVLVLGPGFLVMLPAGGAVMGICMVAPLSMFPVARAASAGVSMGMGASMVTADRLS
jgi:hypothetical protein